MKKNDYDLKDSGDRRDFDTGAVRDIISDKGRMDLLPFRTLIALSKHFQKGAEKYKERNWEKGIPVSVYMDSAMRHQAQFMLGKDDENHLIAGIWNLICGYDTMLRIQEGELSEDLYDLPYELRLPE